jgi:hypothetical protein
MAKRIQKYRGYTVAELINRTDIPSSSSNIVSGVSYMDVYNVTTQDIGSVIGVNSHQVHTLCTSNNINKWSAFSPYIRTVSGSGQSGIIQHSLPTGTTGSLMGSFAGYNHFAVTPSYYNTDRTTTVSTTANAVVNISCDFTLGELTITDNDIQGIAEILGIAFCVFTGGTLVANQVRDIDSGKDEWRAGTGLGFQVTVSAPPSGTQDYTCKLYFISSRTTYSLNTNELCQVFSDVLPSYVKKIRVQTSSAVQTEDPVYTVTWSSKSWTISTGHLSFAGATMSHSYASWLQISTWVEQYNLSTDAWERVTSISYIRDQNKNQPYTSGTDFGSYNVHIWTDLGGAERAAPVPSYDYRCVIHFDGN